MKTVGLSFKSLYKQNGAYLTYGGYIDFYLDDENENYNLCTERPEFYGSQLISCDDEVFEINNIDKNKNKFVLRNVNSDMLVYLTAEEYNIAVIE